MRFSLAAKRCANCTSGGCNAAGAMARPGAVPAPLLPRSRPGLTAPRRAAPDAVSDAGLCRHRGEAERGEGREGIAEFGARRHHRGRLTHGRHRPEHPTDHRVMKAGKNPRRSCGPACDRSPHCGAAHGTECRVRPEWRGPERDTAPEKAETKEEFVKVRRRDLERLTTEVMQLRDFLPKIVNGDILGTFQKLDAIESSLEKKEEEIEQLRMDCEHFRARLETAQADCMREKKEKLDLRQQLNEAKQQLLQQAEYCTEMGAAVCTLLWGVSSNEEAVKSILGGSKAVKFFTITAQTMESFVKSLSEDMKQQDLDSEENQFVLALAGIVTNVAALACGREFLVSSSRELLDTMMHLLGDMKPGLCNKFKVLMLMSLYNVSINLKGLKYISESPGFIPLLWWLLNDPDTEVCLHALRLLQSVLLEPEVLAQAGAEVRETLPFQRIVALSQSRNAELQALAKELLEDLKIFEYEA
ncbi:heat shock factor 2-binding protein isoform X1 [Serinus canaria]|uniref:heat shock factor 2-binding protein isoform X1 n=1 Tax=Serinus canaria TaxID=9135 RepID=UPI0021CCBCEC|nr:heat shock factor 2-binding protein isoform X1 [Serinus canaria]